MLRFVIAFGLLLVFLGTNANALQCHVYSAPIYGSPQQNNATCYILNVSGEVIKPNMAVYGNNGYLQNATNTCPSAGLSSGHFCSIGVTTISPTEAYFCKITYVSPVGTQLGGLFGDMALQNNQTTLQQTSFVGAQQICE